MGRPKKTDGNVKSYLYSFRMSDKSRSQLDYWARKHDVSKPDMIAKALDAYDKIMKTRGEL